MRGVSMGHFFAEMDSGLELYELADFESFQLGHFFAEMDSYGKVFMWPKTWNFNWATSSQKWIVEIVAVIEAIFCEISIGPLLRRNG